MSKYTPLAILTAVILIVYMPIFGSFFQQDEWLAFGYHYLVEKQGVASFLTNAFIPRLGHYSPLNYIVEFILFLTIRLNFFGWAIVSLLLHAIVSFLVYRIASKWIKPKLALLAGIIFAVCTVHLQATAWPVADIGTHGATIFALLSFYYWIKYCESPVPKNLAVSVISLAISLLFKEIAIGMFIAFPVYWLIFAKKKKQLNLVFGPLLILFLILFSIRLSALILPKDAYMGTIYDQKPSVVQKQSLSKFAYNAITFPMKSATQSIIPPSTIVLFSNSVADLLPENISGQPYTPQRDSFVLKYIVEIINFVVFGAIAVLSIKAGKKTVFALTFIMVNSVVFSLSPEKIGRITIIDSRNLYLIGAMSAVLIVMLIQKFYPKKVIFLVVLLILGYGLLTFNIVGQTSTDGTLRHKILAQIMQEYPDLPDKVIIYTQSDTSYYGLPEETKILPFQSGLGQTLLVWYYSQEQFPNEFLEKKFLWEIADQGYMQINDRGFGYFRDFSLVHSELKSNNLSSENVIAYKFDSVSNTFTNITEAVREQLKNGSR